MTAAVTDTADILNMPAERMPGGALVPFSVVPDNDTLIASFADDLMSEYKAAKAAGREKVVFIVPVGPVGQFDIWAGRCNREHFSLRDLVVINMDEYLTRDGCEFIPASDVLSFRGHMDRHFYDLLDPDLAPPPVQRIFPEPKAPERTGETIEKLGGVDVCFGGVGITGHLAFNDPPEPGEPDDPDSFAALPTRVVHLSRETRLINSVTAARGNIDRIPELAVTVGMKEILGSRKVRIYMNRAWQCAILRKLLFGAVTARVPASLLQRHGDARVVATNLVTELPEPELQ